MTKSEFLLIFFDALNGSVDYFVYGSYKALPLDTGGSDIDIVINPRDEAIFLDVFDATIKGSSAFVASKFGRHMYRILNREAEHPWGVQIDVFCGGFYHHEVVYFPVERVKESIINHKGIRVLEESRGFYIGFLKEVIHGSNVKQKYVDSFTDLILQNEERYLGELEELYGKKFRKSIEKGLHLKDYNYATLQKEMLKVVHRGTFMKDMLSFGHRLSRFFRKRPGYVIAILGTDGSGKSTIINSITPWLNEGFHNGVEYRHLRPNFLKPLGVVTGRRKDEVVEVVSNPHAGKTSGWAVSMVKWGYNLFDYTFGYLIKVWPRISTKSVVFLFDRYYYDYYLDQKRFGIHLPVWIIRIGELFVPRPDLTICLGGDPQKIFERKPETSLDEVTRQNAVLERYANKHMKTVFVDTTISIDDTMFTVRQILINTMTKRFSKY